MTAVFAFLRGVWSLVRAILATTPGALVVLVLLAVVGCLALVKDCAAKSARGELATCQTFAAQEHDARVQVETQAASSRQWYASALEEQTAAVKRLRVEGELQAARADVAEGRAAQVQLVTVERVRTIYRDAPRPDSSCADSVEWLRKQLLDFERRWTP